MAFVWIVPIFLLHELGHAVATWACGLRVKGFVCCRKGIGIIREGGTEWDTAQIALAGPFTNLMLALLWWDRPDWAVMNLMLGVTMLLPLEGSDGKRGFKALAAVCRARFAEVMRAN